MTYDTKGIWRCYEIKATKSDFYSNAKKTFVGHYNYFVMPNVLYEEVKDDIPPHVGVYVEGFHSVKRLKKQELSVDEQVLKNSMIRSLSREADKMYRSKNPSIIDSMNRAIDRERKEKENYRIEYNNLLNKVTKKYGTRWDKDTARR